ncbi:N-acetylmuramoyl-L-alanine amidase, partial [Pseudomonas aeruginosa]
GGRISVESVVRCSWNGWPDDRGIRTLGIELEGTDTEPYTDAQYTALAGLTRLLRAAFPAITPERIQGHCDIAPERKTDPGEAFDWSRYRAGLTDSKEET